MQKKDTKGFSIQGVLLLTVLVIIAISILIDFSRKSRDELEKIVESGILQEMEIYSERIGSTIRAAQGATDAVGRILAECYEEDALPEADMLDSIPAVSEAYVTAYCRVSGDGVTSGNKEFDLKQTKYFDRIKESAGDSSFFLYVNNDGIVGKSAILYVCPVKREGVTEGYLLTFLPITVPVKAVQDSDYNKKAFWTFLNSQGKLQFAFGAKDNTSFLEGDFLEKLQNSANSDNDWMSFNMQLKRRSPGSIFVKADEEERFICMVPLEGTDWVFLMGLDGEYVSGKENEIWDDDRNFQLWMCVLLIGILVIIIVFMTLTRLRTTEHRRLLENKADTDLLTGLNNKIATERKIAEYIRENPNGQAVMVLVDVDNFKKINDTVGHVFGDDVLRSLGHQFRAMFRVSDIMGRLGGDEFVIFLKDIGEEDSIEREGRKLEEFFHHFEVGEYVKYSVTASLGAAVFPRDADTFEGLYKAADAALYMAKRRGKNQIAFYKEERKEEME